MKCLVMSLIVMVNMGINLGFATAPANDFAYNSEPADSTGVETRYIYRKTDDGRYLRHHLKYRQQAYTDLRERAVYTPDALGLTYQSYAYDAENGTWDLTCEHEAQAPLLADK